MQKERKKIKSQFVSKHQFSDQEKTNINLSVLP